MTVAYNDLIFAYSFDQLTSGGLLFDSGPLKLHATPGAGGAAPTRQLDGSYAMDGGDYWNLSGAVQARFYANAPTGAWTMLVKAQPTAAGTLALFDCYDAGGGGTNQGITFAVNGYTQWRAYNFIGGGTSPRVDATHVAMTASRLISMAVTVETTPRTIVENAVGTAVWGAGAFAAPSYDTTIVPRIGSAGFFALFTGRVYYMALIRGAVLNADLGVLCAALVNGQKPFCVRR